MRILFVGDIVGKPGRDIVCRAVEELAREHKLDLVVANAENAAGGSGITPAIHRELTKAGVDAITLGDHIYRRR
jgi:calcineurin-like phosphoesterase